MERENEAPAERVLPESLSKPSSKTFMSLGKTLEGLSVTFSILRYVC